MYDDGGHGVDVGAQSVPKWGPEIADSICVWHVEGTCSQLAKHTNPKRQMIKSKGV